MSSIVNKVKDALAGHNETTTTTTTTTTAGTAGPHRSNLANKADPRVDSDLDGRAGGFSSTHNAGGSTNYGPHETNMGNKLDPRVDSDRDGRARHGMTGAGVTGQGLHDTTGLGTSETRRSGIAGNTGYGASTNYGPHDSNLANRLDPLVDSNLDHRGHGTHGTTGVGTSGVHGTTGVGASGVHRAAGAGTSGYGTSTTTGASGYGTGAGTAGYGSSTTGAGYGTGTSANYGPHDSKLANKLDPRVDSDLDHRGHGIHGTTGVGTSGVHGTTGVGTSGVHGTTGVGTSGVHGTTGAGTSGIHHSTGTTSGAPDPRISASMRTGPAPNTAGPHRSDIMNKLDPRVDSDLDGSKTLGGNRAY